MSNPTLYEAQISGFNNAFQNAPTATWSLVQIMDAIRTGRLHHVNLTAQVKRLQHILARDGKRTYDRSKAHLPAVTFGGIFAPSRGNAYLQQHSGIAHGDLDYLPDVAAIKQAISTDPRTVYAFVSPSGEGLKVGVHVPLVADDGKYKNAWHAVKADYERLYEAPWDQSGKDVSRLCFLSSDPQLYFNGYAEPFDVPPMPAPEPPPPSVSWASLPPSPHEARLDYGQRALRTATMMIESAELGTRHFARRNAARLLGGYVAGGLLREDEAYNALECALIGHTEDLKAALKTVKKFLDYGMAYPIRIEALEAERQAWLRAYRSAELSKQHHQSAPPPVAHNPWEGIRTLPVKPYTGLRLRRWVSRG
jgi:hypothetical protein